MNARPYRKAIAVITALLSVLPFVLLAGCASGPKRTAEPVFFPASPNLPRLQYLTGISSSLDVSGESNEFKLFSFGNEVAKKVINIGKPAGIAAAAGKLYIADLTGQVLVVDLPRKTMEPLRGNKSSGKLKKPVGVAVDQMGFTFVADAGRNEVLIYDGKGDFLKSVGGDLDLNPTDVAIHENNLYVVDAKRSTILVLDPETGALIQEIGKGGDAKESLRLPTKMSIDSHGVIRASNAGRGDITSYDRDGHFLSTFGKFGDGMGQFSRPKGLTVDENGYIYVVDAGFQNVQVFNDAGRILTYFGAANLPAGGMNLPCDITISKADLPYYQTFAAKDFELSQVIFVANQFGTPRISLYGYGKMKGIDYDQVYLRAAQEREQKALDALKRRNSAPGQPTQPDAKPAAAL